MDVVNEFGEGHAFTFAFAEVAGVGRALEITWLALTNFGWCEFGSLAVEANVEITSFAVVKTMVEINVFITI